MFFAISITMDEKNYALKEKLMNQTGYHQK